MNILGFVIKKSELGFDKLSYPYGTPIKVIGTNTSKRRPKYPFLGEVTFTKSLYSRKGFKSYTDYDFSCKEISKFPKIEEDETVIFLVDPIINNALYLSCITTSESGISIIKENTYHDTGENSKLFLGLITKKSRLLLLDEFARPVDIGEVYSDTLSVQIGDRVLLGANTLSTDEFNILFHLGKDFLKDPNESPESIESIFYDLYRFPIKNHKTDRPVLIHMKYRYKHYGNHQAAIFVYTNSLSAYN